MEGSQHPVGGNTWIDLLSGWEVIGRQEKIGEHLLLGELSRLLPLQRATMGNLLLKLQCGYEVSGRILSGRITEKE